MKLSFKIASRFLSSNKIQTIFIVLGIAVGISVQLFISLLISGLQKELVNKTIGNSPQVTITSSSTYMDYSNDLINQIKDSSTLDSNITYYLEGNTLLDSTNKNILLRGIDISSYDSIYNIKEHIISGTYPINDNEILLGESYNTDYNINIGDEIQLSLSNGNNYKLKVVGFYKYGVKTVDNLLAFTTLSTSQSIFNKANQINYITLSTDESNIFKADTLANEISNNLDNTYIVDNWKDQNEDLLSGLQGQSISSIMIQVFVVISVSLGISSVLAITVMQKSKQIGILKAMGIKDKASAYIFLIEGLILGFLGALLGIMIGLGLLYLFTVFAVNPDGSPIVQIYIKHYNIIISFIIAVVSSLVASLIPAMKSSKLDPIDIIRNN